MAKKTKNKKSKPGGVISTVVGADLIDTMADAAQAQQHKQRLLPRLWTALGPPPLALQPGEQFRLATRMHRYVLARDIARGLAELPVAAVVSILLDFLSGGLWWIQFLIWGIAIAHQGKYAYRMLKWRAKVLVVTSKRRVVTSGVLRRDADSLALAKIKGINVKQSFVGRVFGFGHVLIKLTGGTDDEAQEVLAYVPKPHDVQRAMYGAQLVGA